MVTDVTEEDIQFVEPEQEEPDEGYEPEPDPNLPRELNIPEKMPYCANVIIWYLVVRNWQKAIALAGFDPTDKIILRDSQRALGQHREFFENQIGEHLQAGLKAVQFDPRMIQEGLEKTMMDYARFLKRNRKLSDKTTNAIERAMVQINADKQVMEVITSITVMISNLKQANEKNVTPAIQFGG
jgi:hypothetical protein